MSGLRSTEDMGLQGAPAATCDEEAIGCLKPGDIVFGRSQGSTIPRIITALDGYWSHAMLYVGQQPDGTHEIAEATTDGIRLVPVETLRDRYPKGLGALRPRVERAQRQAAADYARGLIESDRVRSYSEHDLGLSFVLLLRSGGKEAIRRLKDVLMDRDDIPSRSPVGDWVPPPFESTCSGLVYRSYTESQPRVALPVQVSKGLTLRDGKVVLAHDEPVLELLDRPAEEGFADSSDIHEMHEVLLLIKEAVPGFLKGLLDKEFNIEEVVTPGDLWQMDPVAGRWLFRESDRPSRLVTGDPRAGAARHHP